jgi:membrane protein YdbS with pleckstrin-like domain
MLIGLADAFLEANRKDAIMKCDECGGSVADTATFCSHCGARLEAGDDKARQDADASEPNAGRGSAKIARGSAGGKRGNSRGAQPAEQELWSGTYSPKAMIGPAIGCVVVSVLSMIAVAAFSNTPGSRWALVIGLAVLWTALGLTLLYRRITVRYRLTTYRLFHDTGLLSRTGNRIEVIDVDDVTVHQRIIERMFGVGTINIASSDRTDPNLRLPGIENVRDVADLIDGTRRAERHRRGLHIESI